MGEACVHRVDGVRGGRAQRDVAAALALGVLNRPGRRDLSRARGVDIGVGAHALGQGRNQGKGLEGRARLPAHLRSEIELTLLVVLAADHRDDVARARIDARKRRVEAAVLLRHGLLDGLVGGLLRLGVDRGVDGQAALGELGDVELLGLEQLLDVVDEVRGEVGVVLVLLVLGVVELGLLRHRLVVLLLADLAVGEHAVEHEVGALECRVIVLTRVVGVGRLGDADEHRRLGQGELVGGAAKVILGRGLDAVVAVTVVDHVDVHHQDLVFCVLLLDLERDVHLADLALDGDVVHLVEKHRVADELLGDRRRAFAPTAGDVGEDRAADAHEIDAVVVVEALVFRSDRSVEDVAGDLVGSNLDAVLQRDLCKLRLPVSCVDSRIAGLGVQVDVAVVGKVLQPCRAGDDNSEHATDDEGHDGADYAGKPARALLGLGMARTAARVFGHRFLLCA